MLVNEFDTKLDMQGILTLDLDMELLNAAKKFNVYAEGNLSLNNGGIELYAYDHLSKKAPIFREEMNCETIILFHEMGKQK
ncbi:MAG: hypothetical protein ACYCPR_01020 [Thermoplasmataceae archaeon]